MFFFNRQAADHRYLVMYSRKELASGNKEAEDVEKLCDLCHDAVEDLVVSLRTSTHSLLPNQEIRKERRKGKKQIQKLHAPFNCSLSIL